ncbi:MAG: hypothetical protein HYZ75_09730 [Elusimicrobia bacterium]|nr:hypothetical protein [Elusimicrobiota bacterium]
MNRRLIAPEKAQLAAVVLLAAVFVGGALPTQLALDPAQAFTLALTPFCVIACGLLGAWRGKRFGIKGEGAQLALPGPSEAGVPLRPRLLPRLTSPWLWLTIATALLYAAAATAGILPDPNVARGIYDKDGALTVFKVQPEVLGVLAGKFWILLAASAVTGLLAFCAWLDDAAED